MRKAITIVNTVINNLLNNQEEQDRLGTIYNSLSQTERFFVRMVYDSERREIAQRLLSKKDEQIWTTTGIRMAMQVTDTNLVTGSWGHFRLNMVQQQYLSRVPLRGYELQTSTTLEDVSAWAECLLIPQPTDPRSKELIIHQFSDLYLGAHAPWNTAWDAYLAYLEMRCEKNWDRSPDIIIIAGNVLGIPRTDDVRQDYEDRLSFAADNIEKAVKFLRPMHSEHSYSPSQIVIVPGIFDLDWMYGNNINQRRKKYFELWEKYFKRFTCPGSGPYLDEARNVEIYAFNTASLQAVYEHGREGAVEDLSKIRSLLQGHLHTDWADVEDHESEPERAQSDGVTVKLKESAARLANFTFNYMIDASNDAYLFESISDPTFKFHVSVKGDDEVDEDSTLKSIIVDAGFVCKAENEQLMAGTKKTESVRAGKDQSPPAKVRLAVTHHLPHDRRHAGVTEFIDGFEFRQNLVRAGVHVVLHGHGSGQQVLTEKVSFKGKETEHISTTLDLIGAGSFSPLEGKVGELLGSSDWAVSAKPSFNEIRISPNPTNPTGPRIITTSFYELDGRDFNMWGSVPLSHVEPK